MPVDATFAENPGAFVFAGSTGQPITADIVKRRRPRNFHWQIEVD